MNSAYKLTLSRKAARAYAEAQGHRMGRHSRSYGGSGCNLCGAVLMDLDAVEFVTAGSVFALGTLSAPCVMAHDIEDVE